MNKNLLWLGAAVVVLVGIVAFTLMRPTPPPPPCEGADCPPTPTPTVTPGIVKLPVASSSTKKAWMEAAKAGFNEASKNDRRWQVDGKPVVVEFLKEEIDPGVFDHYRSGTMVKDIQLPDGDPKAIRPVVASPSEESWLEGLNSDWRASHRQDIMTQPPATLVRVPVVFALWESRARALGCWPTPTKDCTWQRFRDLASDPAGWGAYGHPDWGAFKIGYGYVGESNSGTLTAILLCMAGLQKTTGLTVADVEPDNGCGQMIGAMDKAKVHSGKKSGWLLEKLKTGGPEYLDGQTTNEPDVIKFNIENQGKLREPLVSAYPQDGTVVSKHPFGILDAAPWVTPEQLKAAELFREYLLSAEMQAKAMELNLRPADPSAKLGAPIDLSYGANPDATLVAVDVPDALTFDQVVAVWHKVKKHAAVVIVFDKSGSMSGERITQAVSGARTFVGMMDMDDWLMWMPFDDKTYYGDQGLKSQIGEQLQQDIRATAAGGGTALYDTVYYAYDLLQARRAMNGNTERYGIVVLTDGENNGGTKTLPQLQARLAPDEKNPASVQIYSIGIGEANMDVLNKIATGAHGKATKSNPQDIEAAYKEIVWYF